MKSNKIIVWMQSSLDGLVSGLRYARERVTA